MVQARDGLLQAWRDRIDPAASRERVAIAFALLGGGAALAAMGVVLVGLSDAVLTRPSWLREVGFVAAAGGLPLFLLGIVVALPGRTWVRVLAGLGVVGCGVGVGLFTLWYPDQWHLTVQFPNGYAIGAYLAGASVLAASSGSSLATYFIEQARGPGTEEVEQAREVSDEEIAADLAWANRQGWSWGGIKAQGPEVPIHLRDDLSGVSFLGQGPHYILEEEPLEESARAAEALAALRGRTKGEHTDAEVSDQVDFLKQLKQQQAQEEAARRESWGWKLTHPLEWLRG